MRIFLIGDQFARTRGRDLWPFGRRYTLTGDVRILGVAIPAGTSWDGGTGVAMRRGSPLAGLFLWHDMMDRDRARWVLPVDALFLALWLLTGVGTALRGVIRLDAGDLLSGLWAIVGWCVYAPLFVLLYPTRLAFRYSDETWVRWSVLACNGVLVGIHGILLAPWP